MLLATATLAHNAFLVAIDLEMCLSSLLGGEFFEKIEQFHILFEFALSSLQPLTPRVKNYWQSSRQADNFLYR